MEVTEGHLDYLWTSNLETFPVLTFSTTYEYVFETGFSRVLHIKTKCRGRMSPQHNVEIGLDADKEPSLVQNWRNKQQQPSH